ncbi:MAG: [FeFe] hydrogenase H-cluster radical SAM maturase HydE [Lachnospiraceae bacterium]|nr:[FeFe] hydrogenase H-cluster radical SAM maturase HydE [Lachnospiraceae bacterium]
MKTLLDKLEKEHILSLEEYEILLKSREEDLRQILFEKADRTRRQYYGRDIYVRGLIEFTNYCKNNCYYCGIRAGNTKAQRYRLTEEEILSCCDRGYGLGYRTFVLQGGEDVFFTPKKMADLICQIKERYSDCALTLSIGEHSREVYKMWKEAGADRYLLRHETADKEHYRKLHPKEMLLENRKQCLYDLKELGYQVGCGFMVGSPAQTYECLAKDLKFIESFQPHMVGIGPFISHKDTPFADKENGSVELTLRLLALVRLIVPNVLLPATTALGTLRDNGRELGILAGANVCMPNLSPECARENYMLYDKKLSTGEESAEEIENLRKKMKKIGYNVVVHRGDCK